MLIEMWSPVFKKGGTNSGTDSISPWIKRYHGYGLS